MKSEYFFRLTELEKQLPNVEFGEDSYWELVEQIRLIYLEVDGSKPNLISKAVKQDEKNFNNSFEQYSHGLIQIVRDLIAII